MQCFLYHNILPYNTTLFMLRKRVNRYELRYYRIFIGLCIHKCGALKALVSWFATENICPSLPCRPGAGIVVTAT